MYRVGWSWQFKAIDDELDRITRQGSQQKPENLDLDQKTRSESYGKLPVEKQQSSPMTFGSTDALLTHDMVAPTNGISGACSSGNICVADKNNILLKKSHSTSYSKMQTNVMGKIKDRTGVPV